MQMQSLAPLFIVDEIEPCLSFWTERLGYEVHANVKEGDRYGFVLLLKDGVQLMYQTESSLAKDLPQLNGRVGRASSFLYITVDNIDVVERALTGVPLVQTRRETFYGATEIIVREPAGNLVAFAQHSR